MFVLGTQSGRPLRVSGVTGAFNPVFARSILSTSLPMPPTPIATVTSSNISSSSSNIDASQSLTSKDPVTQNNSSIVSGDQMDALRAEISSVLGNDIDANSGQGNIIDETLFREEEENEIELDGIGNGWAGEGDGETDAEMGGVLFEYLKSLIERFKKEITDFGHPAVYRGGSFWSRPRHPVFALEASRKTPAGINPRELYHRDVFVWLLGLPTRLPGEPDALRCPNCKTRQGQYQTLSRKGYNSDPPARRVKGLHRDYFLLTNRLECVKTSSGGCGTKFQATDPDILAQLSRTLQEAFPAFLTAHAAVDKNLVSIMRSCFATRFGPEPFTKMVAEMQFLDHAHLELLYVSALQSSPTSHPSPSGPESFSHINDKLRYAAKTSSTQFYSAVFVDWMQAHRVFFDRVMACLTGKILRGDHTFKVIIISFHIIDIFY